LSPFSFSDVGEVVEEQIVRRAGLSFFSSLFSFSLDAGEVADPLAISFSSTSTESERYNRANHFFFPLLVCELCPPSFPLSEREVNRIAVGPPPLPFFLCLRCWEKERAFFPVAGRCLLSPSCTLDQRLRLLFHDDKERFRSIPPSFFFGWSFLFPLHKTCDPPFFSPRLRWARCKHPFLFLSPCVKKEENIELRSPPSFLLRTDYRSRRVFLRPHGAVERSLPFRARLLPPTRR